MPAGAGRPAECGAWCVPEGACAHRGCGAADRSRGRIAVMPLAATCNEPGRPQALHEDVVTKAMTPEPLGKDAEVQGSENPPHVPPRARAETRSRRASPQVPSLPRTILGLSNLLSRAPSSLPPVFTELNGQCPCPAGLTVPWRRWCIKPIRTAPSWRQ